MEDNNDIDDLSRSALKHYKMNPPSESWDALDAELSARQSLRHKAKTKRFLILASGFVFLLVSVITFNYLTHPNNSNPGVTVNSKIQPVVTKQLESLNANAAKAETSSPSEKVKKNAVSPAVKNQAAEIIHADNNASEHTENNMAMNEVKKSRIHSNKFSQSDEKINSHIADKNISNDNTVSIAPPVPIVSHDNEPGALINDSGTPAEKNSVITTPVDNSIVQPAQPGETAAQVSVRNDAELNYLKNDSVILNESISRWSIAIYYSPDHSKNHLEGNYPDYKDETEFYDNEKPVYSFTTGISLRYDLNKRWSISAGAAYSTIAYSITLPELYAGYNSNNELNYQYPTSCGIIQMPSSDYPVWNEHDSINLKAACEQKVEFIKVPLTARFTIAKEKFSYFSDIGLSANFTIQERAKVIIQNNETTIINNIDGLKKMNYDFLFGMGVQYNFITGTGIFIEPSYRRAITSLTESTSVNCYPYSFGLNIGLSFHFK